MVFTYGHDTAGTDCVVGGRFISHVLEVVDNGWHYHNSFLEESQPYVPLLVFEDGVYLGLVKVETGNVDRAFHYLSLLDVIHFHSVSVGSDVDFILVHVIEGLDGQFRMRRTLNAGEAVCLRIVFEQSVFQASHVDISCFVFADGRRPHHFSPIRIVRHPLVGVYAVYSFVIGDYPQCSVTVFVELVDEIAFGTNPGSCRAVMRPSVTFSKNIPCPDVPINISPLSRSIMADTFASSSTSFSEGHGNVGKTPVARSYVCRPFNVPTKKVPFLSSKKNTDIIVLQGMFIVGVMFVYAEFGAVVSVQSVFGGNPYNVFFVLIDTVDHALTTRCPQ